MFKSESEENEELGFADAYKNEILKNREPQKETSYKGLIVIISLVTFVLGGAIFGYIYFSNSSSDTETIEEPEESKLINIDDIEEDDNESELNSSADANNDNIDKENYIEDLAKLSKGIDEGM